MRPGKYSKSSRRKLATCHEKLIILCEAIISAWDHTILYGHRGEEEQEQAFNEGRSTLHYPESKHNKIPSLAVDLAPYHAEENPPIDWNNIERWRAFGGFVMGVAYHMGIKIRWGGDWDGDWTFTDQRLIDLPHIELIE